MAQYSETVQANLDRIDGLQEQIDALRPVSKEQVNKIFQKYRLDWNYNSNSIEGNSLNYGETVAFIMEGLTAKGKPLKDHLDIKGHNEAIDFLVDMQEKGAELTERDIRGLHQMILVEPYQSKAQTADGQPTTKTIQLGVYKSSPNHVETATGQIHYYATPQDTPMLMQELMDWYRENRNTLHPLVLSALFHHKFVSIHPFDDGNGRMSRLLSNLMLMQAGFPPVIVRKDQKREYYGALSQADAGVTEPLLEYFADLLIHSLELYLKGARGEDFADPDDLDKQLALFVSSFDEELLTREEMSMGAIQRSFDESVLPLLNKISQYCKKINVLFHNYYMRGRREAYSGEGTDYQPIEPSKAEEWLRSTDGNLRTTFIRDFYDPDLLSIRAVVFSYVFGDFKANPTIGNFRISVSVTFNNFDYVFKLLGDSDSEVITKHYPRQLTQVEIDSMTNRAVRRLMEQITAKNKEVSKS